MHIKKIALEANQPSYEKGNAIMYHCSKQEVEAALNELLSGKLFLHKHVS